MTCTQHDLEVRARATRRRVGYVAAATANLVLLWVANHLLDWQWPPFLTDDFSDLLPWVSFSLVATAVVDALWAWRDPAWFKHLGQLGLNAIGIVVAVRTWQIFPFDFSAYSFDWNLVARLVIAAGFLGMVASSITELVGLAHEGARDSGARGPSDG